ncbi:MAG: hypothetical protein QM534_00505 [Sediminibacterium sp.]|nr:hypothetical protein [Sediminibacterium sp.]
MKKLTVILFIFLNYIGFSAIEESTASFQSGTSIGSNQPLAVGSTIFIQDGWYSFMNLNQLTYQNTFKIASNEAILRLRYDDSKKFDYGQAWQLTVTYDIELYDITNTTTPYSTITNEMLTINYMNHSAPGNYIDISLKKYQNAPKVKVTITNVQFTPGGPSVPSVFQDIYLDVVQRTERYYVLNPSVAPAVTTQFGFNNTLTTGNAKIQLPIAWSQVQGAESYDVEWLFIDAGSSAFTTNFNFDFRNATRINVPFNHYEIQLAYPRGIMLYRVRPVGYNYDIATTTLTRVEGRWSFITGVGTTAANAPAVNAAYRYNFDGLNPDVNWKYLSTYSEDGKKREIINYFDGASVLRQSVGMNYTEDNAVVTEPLVDFEGREAGLFMPAPTVNNGIRYYGTIGSNGFNPNYNPVNYDTDAKINTPDPVATTSGAGNYFSSSNSLTGGIYPLYTPDAEGYPFVRTTFLTDGTGRVRTQSNVGVQLKSGSGKEINFIYGKPNNQIELNRLFGTEAGFVKNYFKTGVKDENGQVMVSYLDNHGRTVATCLAGSPPSNLYALDYKPTVSPINIDILDDNNTINAQNELISSQPLTVMLPTLYKFKYNLQPSQFCKNCPPSYQLCADCKYDLEISIKDQYGFLVSNINITSSSPSLPAGSNPMVFSDVTTGLIEFEVQFNPGVYQLDKVLKINQASLNAVVSQYMNDQLLDPTCLSYPKIEPEPCGNGCRSACEERYTRFNFTTNAVEYIDDNENIITQAAALTLINACEGTCNNPQYPVSDAGYCDLKLKALKKDFSPGGQYFSNTVMQFINDPQQGIIESPTYQSQKYDYLITNLASQSSALFTTFSGISGVSINSWADVENNWNPVFADHLVIYHPEYCAYKYFCEGGIVCGREGTPGYTVISIPASNDFDDMLTQSNMTTAQANNYFNTIGVSYNSTHSTADFLSGNTNYCPYNTATGVNQDPFVEGDCTVELTKCSSSSLSFLSNYLKKFVGNGSGGYFSIWYVLDDPDNIHLIPVANASTPPQAVIDFFKQLHGDGTPSNPGLFATTSKWEFFRSQYLFLKQLFIYDHYGKYACPAPSIKKPLATMPTTVSLTHNQFTIHFPKNPIFDAIVNSTGGICNYQQNLTVLAASFTTQVSNGMTTECNTNCTQAADIWMNELSGCNLTPAQANDIRFYLIEVCKKECNTSNPNGTSGCNNGNPGCSAVAGPAGALFYNFTDVINYFTSGSCQVVVKHPPQLSDVNCACANLNNYIIEQGLSNASNAAIATAFNATFNNTTSYTATDIANWRSVCNSSSASLTALTSASFPPSFVCSMLRAAYDEVGCSCEKINQFINAIGYDPANTAHYPYIVAGINNYLGSTSMPPITIAQLTTILSNCTNASISSIADFTNNNVPPVLLCPEPAGNSPQQIQEASQLADCQLNNLLYATNQAVSYFQNFALPYFENNFRNEFVTYCLTQARDSKESFIMDYLLDEFKYTLYYYDQAGNLVKTVPPEGVEVISAQADLLAVANYQNGTSTIPFYPPHRMKTRAKYDSYNNKTENETPDGGLSMYWYNSKSQIVNSQTAKQRSASPQKYGYTRYDNVLARITESGELSNSTVLTQAIARDRDPVTTYQAWYTNAGTSQTQINKTYYDNVALTITPNPFGVSGQQNLRNKIVHVTYQEAYGSAYDQGLHYSYDEHGFVDGFAQESNYKDASNNPIVPASEKVKYMKMKYNLEDRTLKEVSYQPGAPDQYYQRFEYDADNRLARVYSSYNRNIWELDAKYFYYKHSQLARVEQGDKQVQGQDFAYTLQGWLKGMNSSFPSAARDIGKDAHPVNTNVNNHFGTDASAFTNGYFVNDYKAISPALNVPSGNFVADPFFATNVFGDYLYNTGANPRNYNLYNGIIAHSTYGAQRPDGTQMEVLGRSYIYDQGYRIKENFSYKDANLSSNNYWSASAVTTNYKEQFTYDMNGNIRDVNRDAFTTSNVPQVMDVLRYRYATNGSGKRINNKLYGIDDLAGATNYNDDIDDQAAAFSLLPPDSDPALNYGYNADGQLQKDLSEGISSIEYTVFGKIRKINRNPSFFRLISSVYVYPSDVEYLYDAHGKRIMKIEKPRTGTGLGGSPPSVNVPQNQWRYTYYTYDLDGNIVSVYTKELNSSTVEFRLKEQYVIGTGRAAQINKNMLLPATNPTNLTAQRELGTKTFELGGNAGVIYATITDYKVSGATVANLVNYYKPVVLETKDYFSFGAPIPNRNFISKTYRFGHNGGSERDKEVMNQENMYGTFFRELDTRSGRWWSRDPVFNASESPYMVNSDNPINFTDPYGDKVWTWLKANTDFNVRFAIEKSDEGWSYSAAAGAKLNILRWLNFSTNLSVRYYGGALGSTGKDDAQIDVVFTPALAVGFSKKGRMDETEPIAQNIFNSYSLFAVDNEYRNSIVYGTSFVFNSEGRNQVVAGFMLKFNRVFLAKANDVLPVSDGNDRWWTGSFQAGYNFTGKAKLGKLGVVSWGYDAFTGERIVKDSEAEMAIDKYETYPIGDHNYYKQSPRGAELTNGMTFGFLKSTGKEKRVYLTGGINVDKMNPMWFQNAIHDNFKKLGLGNEVLPRFQSTDPLILHITKYN